MKLHRIHSEEDFNWAMDRLGEIIDAKPGTLEFTELEILSTLAKEYERAHHSAPTSYLK